MRFAIALFAAAAGFARAAHGDPPLPFEADIACYKREFGEYPLQFPAAWFYIARSSYFLPPETEDDHVNSLLYAAFEGNVRAIDEALRNGASAKLTVDSKGKLVGNDVGTESAEAQFARYQEDRATREKAESGTPLIRRRTFREPRQIAPRLMQDYAVFGFTPEVTSVLTWAIVGARHQWCMQRAFNAQPWPGLPAVKRLVSRGANPAYEDIAGRSPVAFAISSLDPTSPTIAQREQLARMLIESLPKSIPRSTLTRWLVLAASRGDKPIAGLLLAKGADASDPDVIWQASIHGNDPVAELLASRGARLEFPDTPEVRERLERGLISGNPLVLDVATKNGAAELLASVARENRTGVNLTGYNVMNPEVLRFLGKAGVKCRGGMLLLFGQRDRMDAATFRESLIVLLEDMHCDPTEGAVSDKTAVMLIDDADADLVTLLGKHGGATIQPSGKDQFGRDLPKGAATAARTLSWATSNDRPNLAAATMQFNRPQPDEAARALQDAVHQNRTRVAIALLTHGANPNQPVSNDGMTPLMEAERTRNVEIVAALLDAGADIEARTNPAVCTPHECPFGYTGKLTALMIAAKYGDEPVAMLLLKRGADKNQKSESGMKAADYARLSHRALADKIERYPD